MSQRSQNWAVFFERTLLLYVFDIYLNMPSSTTEKLKWLGMIHRVIGFREKTIIMKNSVAILECIMLQLSPQM